MFFGSQVQIIFLDKLKNLLEKTVCQSTRYVRTKLRRVQTIAQQKPTISKKKNHLECKSITIGEDIHLNYIGTPIPTNHFRPSSNNNCLYLFNN